ncbi:hypothetical protein NPIL_348611 [Nephila pilipes]|uniref:Uncharacterized protein n=1 Tax=Nephila pilipes TaxID=299642 RepID=A0A8X6MND2_NEPPI|nr:hypothetical protein NPIL_348611 [Nephila pilipes]
MVMFRFKVRREGQGARPVGSEGSARLLFMGFAGMSRPFLCDCVRWAALAKVLETLPTPEPSVALLLGKTGSSLPERCH